jgi:gliding motility-associated-like protein
MYIYPKHISVVLQIILWIFCVGGLRAQNLVPNPSFEEYNACPDLLGQIYRCEGWNSTVYGSSTDYYNICNVFIPNVTQNVGVPNNFWGYLPAYAGDAYAGMVLYNHPASNNYREYLKNSLTAPMLPGMRYRISFQMAFVHPVVNTNAVGVHLSTVPPMIEDTTFTYMTLLPLTATLNHSVTSDSLFAWQAWQQDYVAGGGERYFVIGNFHTSVNTTGMTPGIPQNGVYVFIDEVSVMLVGQDVFVCEGDSVTLTASGGSGYTWVMGSDTNQTVLATGTTFTAHPTGNTSYIAYGATDTTVYNVHVNPIPNVMLGADTTFCETANKQLSIQGTNPPGTQYQWQDNSTGPYFVPTQAGAYWVRADLYGCMASDSIYVAIDSAVTVSLGPDLHLCVGDSLLLYANCPQAVSYQWQDMSVDSTLSVSAGGVYSVTVTRGLCSASDSMLVIQDSFPILSLGNDRSICGQGPLVLDATFPGATYLWQNGATTPTLSVNTTGLYGVRSGIGACFVSDSVWVRFFPLPSIDLGVDTLLCEGQYLLLGTASGLNALWQDGSVASTFTVQAPGQYQVMVTDSNGCQSSDGIEVTYMAAPEVSFVDTILCDGTPLLLDITAMQGVYLWSDKSTDAQYTIVVPGTYWGMATNRCGVAADTLRVEYRPCDCLLYIPTSFTPNDDHVNERFGPIPISGCELTEYTFGIYDRWGGLLYQTANPEQPWDGYVHGHVAPNDIYVYQVTYRFRDDVLRFGNGSVVLVR